MNDTWDGRDCPKDGCNGELQQQDAFNVMCLRCGDVWTHYEDDDEHKLVSQETVVHDTIPKVSEEEVDA